MCSIRHNSSLVLNYVRLTFYINVKFCLTRYVEIPTRVLFRTWHVRRRKDETLQIQRFMEVCKLCRNLSCPNVFNKRTKSWREKIHHTAINVRTNFVMKGCVVMSPPNTGTAGSDVDSFWTLGNIWYVKALFFPLFCLRGNANFSTFFILFFLTCGKISFSLPFSVFLNLRLNFGDRSWLFIPTSF